MGILAGFGVVLWFVVHVDFVGWLHGCTSCNYAASYPIVRAVKMRRYNTNGVLHQAETKTSVKGVGIAPIFTVLNIILHSHTSSLLKEKMVQNSYKHQ